MKGFVGGIWADRILEYFPRIETPETTVYDGRSKLEMTFGPNIWAEFHGKTVVDFGCGDGKECVEIAEHGASRVIGLDIRRKVLDIALERTRAVGLTKVILGFGPIWGHPLGGHMFSVFPWAHLVFTESALMRWRAKFRSGNLTRFSEMPEPLNRMTIHRFKRLVKASPLCFASFRAVPIRRLIYFHNRLTQEFFTSVVQCRLCHRSKAGR